MRPKLWATNWRTGIDAVSQLLVGKRPLPKLGHAKVNQLGPLNATLPQHIAGVQITMANANVVQHLQGAAHLGRQVPCLLGLERPIHRQDFQQGFPCVFKSLSARFPLACRLCQHPQWSGRKPHPAPSQTKRWTSVAMLQPLAASHRFSTPSRLP